MEFIHSVLVQNAAVTAGDVVSYDLPVNPLSHILLTLRFSQNNAHTMTAISDVLGMIDKVEVLNRGSAVYSMSGLDAFAAGLFVSGFESWGVNADGNDNDARSLTLLIPFTRTLYSPVECFGRSTRGELRLQITYASSFSNIDSVSAQIETVELPDASPTRHVRMTTLAVTPASTGELDIDLPIGNRIVGAILYGTTIPAGATDTDTVNYVQLLIDNQRRYYSQSNFETLHNMAGRLRPAPGYWGYHTHRLTAASYSQYDDVSPVQPADHVLKNHLYLPLDVLGDLSYALETAGASDVTLRINAGDTNPLRVVPVEIVGS